MLWQFRGFVPQSSYLVLGYHRKALCHTVLGSVMIRSIKMPEGLGLRDLAGFKQGVKQWRTPTCILNQSREPEVVTYHGKMMKSPSSAGKRHKKSNRGNPSSIEISWRNHNLSQFFSLHASGHASHTEWGAEIPKQCQARQHTRGVGTGPKREVSWSPDGTRAVPAQRCGHVALVLVLLGIASHQAGSPVRITPRCTPTPLGARQCLSACGLDVTLLLLTS